MLERHVLVAEGVDDLGAHVAQQLEEAALRVDAQPQRQCVDEEAHHLLELGQVAAAHRRPDHEVALARGAVKQQRPGAQQRHEQRRAFAQADLAERLASARGGSESQAVAPSPLCVGGRG